MSEDTAGDTPVKLESYALEKARPEELGIAAAADDPSSILPLRITLHGQCFMISSIDPKIMIGDLQLTDFETMSDLCTIVGYLYELPQEGSVISIDYGEGLRAELAERFSLKKLHQAGSSSEENGGTNSSGLDDA